MVMDKVTDMMVTVMGESTGSDECYDCDGKNEKSDEFKNNVEFQTGCNMPEEGQKEEKEILEEVLEMPSHASQEEVQSQKGQEVTDIQVAIRVGDKVTVNDCPAHWLWASPLTVESIDGNLVKLEMVSELVEIERLFVTNG